MELYSKSVDAENKSVCYNQNRTGEKIRVNLNILNEVYPGMDTELPKASSHATLFGPTLGDIVSLVNPPKRFVFVSHSGQVDVLDDLNLTQKHSHYLKIYKKHGMGKLVSFLIEEGNEIGVVPRGNFSSFSIETYLPEAVEDYLEKVGKNQYLVTHLEILPMLVLTEYRGSLIRIINTLTYIKEV